VSHDYLGYVFYLLHHLTGIESLHDGDVMTFFWNSTCQFPELEQGKTYIIIGKDGFKIRDGENEV
jgi:hypothetical protein